MAKKAIPVKKGYSGKKDLADAILSGESKSLASLSAEELMGLLG